MRTEFKTVTGWQDGGRVERLNFVPRSLRGRARACAEASVFSRPPRADVTWTSAIESVTPFLLAQVGPVRKPLVLEMDWTFAQQEAFAQEYFGREPRVGIAYRMGQWREDVTFAAADRLVTMSNWAAASLRKQGIDPARIAVIHPGLDLGDWRPLAESARASGPFRLLFVGGDFKRKGGPELLDVFSAKFSGRCVLDIVTTAADVEPRPGVRVHRLGPNSAELRSLYQHADVFVLPTRAECFGHAAVEAMASGVPVIITDVGGTADIVEHRETGWLIGPGRADLELAIEAAISQPELLRAMGLAARARAERLFDGQANDHRLADLLISLSARNGPAAGS